MMDIDKLVGYMVQLEREFHDLKKDYDDLMDTYKKDVDDAYRSGYRNGLESQKDSSGQH